MAEGRSLRIFAVCFLVVWILFVLYPQPYNLFKSVYRLFNHPVNPQAEGVQLLAKEVADMDLSEAESFILKSIPYDHDWNVYGMPWYFPKAEEVLTRGRGDCKSRFIITASVFENLDIPYHLHLSSTHVWIDYEGRRETTRENKEIALLLADEEKAEWRVPKVDWEHTKNSFVRSFWGNMPTPKKIMLLEGSVIFLLLNLLSVVILDKKPEMI